jgi:hypothetical protein
MTAPVSPPSRWQRLVGVFVLVQLVFILASNSFFLIERVFQREPDEPPSAVSAVAETLPKVTRPYAHATGQLQGWSLFAPNVPHRAAFVVTEVQWHGGQTRKKLRSENMPADLKDFVQPFGTGRLLQYELHLRLLSLTWSPRATKEPELWRRLSADEIRNRHQAIRAYLNWRWLEYSARNPGHPPPEALVLRVFLYDLPPPGGARLDDAAWRYVPLARWRPGVTPPAGCLPVEMIDLGSWQEGDLTEQFEWVPERAGNE